MTIRGSLSSQIILANGLFRSCPRRIRTIMPGEILTLPEKSAKTQRNIRTAVTASPAAAAPEFVFTETARVYRRKKRRHSACP
jgi:hypothetical protein